MPLKIFIRPITTFLIAALTTGVLLSQYDAVRAFIGGRGGSPASNSGHATNQRIAANPNLVGYYDFEGDANNRAAVATNNLTDNATVTQAAAGGGNAGQFTSANSEYLSAVDSANLSLGTNDSFEIAFWVYFDTLQLQGLVSKYNATGDFLALANTNELQWYVVNTDGTVDSVTNASAFGTTGVWYLVNAWHDADADQIGFSIDNGTATTKSHTGGTKDGTQSFLIGTQEGTIRFLNGRMDEIGYWKGRVLTSAERTALYNGGNGKRYADLSDSEKTSLNAWWDMNEGSGARADIHSTNDLTDNATVTQAAGKVLGRTNFAGQFTSANSEYLSVSDNAALSTGNIDFTWAGWVYADSLSGSVIGGKWLGDDSDREYVVSYGIVNASRFELVVRNTDDSGQTSVAANNLGAPVTATWYYIVAWHDASSDTINIQVNNGTADSASHTAGARDSGAAMALGAYSAGGSHWDGRIDNVGFFKRVLTSTERTALYNSGVGKDYSQLSNTEKTSLISWWDLNEGSGTRADTHRSGGNNGSVTGASLTTGKYGQAYDFSGSAQYVDLGTGISQSGEMTVSAWINADSVSSVSQVVSNGDGSNQNWTFEVGRTSGKLSVVQGGALVLTGSATLSTSTWYHVALIRSGSTGDWTLTLYLNGVADASATTATNPSGGTLKTVVGALGDLSSHMYNGRVDDVRIYNDNLSADQIGRLYRGSNPINCDQSCLGWWKLDEPASSKNAVDSMMKNPNNLTDNNTVTQAAGAKVGNAGQFTAANSEYLSVSDNAALSMGGNTSFTLGAWVYFDAKAAQRAILGKYQTTTNQEYLLWYNTTLDRFRFNVYSDGTDGTLTAVNADTLGVPATATWYFVLAWYDGTNINISINNGAADTAAFSAGVYDGAAPLEMGANSSLSFNWDGRIDEVGIWKRVLTSAERTSLYNSGNGKGLGSLTPGEKAGLAAWYNLDEASGSRSDNFGGTGAASGSPSTGIPGALGAAIDFDGADDYVLAPDADILDVGTSDFSVEAWVYGDSMANSDVIFAKSNGGAASSTYGFHFSVYDSLYPTLHFASAATALAKIQSDTAIADGQWYHLVAVVDRDNTSNTVVYINGKATTTTVSNLSDNTGAVSNSVGLAIGAESDAAFFWDGKIDDVRLYNRILASYEVYEHYSAGR